MSFYQNSNNPANDVYDYESEIIETRDKMFWDLQTTGSTFVNNKEVTIFDLLENIEEQDKDEIISMLIRRESKPLADQSSIARSQAMDLLMTEFLSEYDDEAIIAHYIDEKTSY
jgi:hypothetical protein|tara:strand:- start:12 stop:353 length:342 start_codon:yes stop_codon:yes gene_type:complete